MRWALFASASPLKYREFSLIEVADDVAGVQLAKELTNVQTVPHTAQLLPQQLMVILPWRGAKSSKKTVIGSIIGAPVITSFLTVERSTCSGSAGFFLWAWGHLKTYDAIS